jgi:hypothetical protein
MLRFCAPQDPAAAGGPQVRGPLQPRGPDTYWTLNPIVAAAMRNHPRTEGDIATLRAAAASG